MPHAAPIAVAGALAIASLGTTCGSRSTSPADEPAPTTRGDQPAASGGRYIVSLRPVPGDTARPTRAALEARLPAATLQASGGRVVDAVLALHALVVDGVRDPEPLRRDPNVASVVPDLPQVPQRP